MEKIVIQAHVIVIATLITIAGAPVYTVQNTENNTDIQFHDHVSTYHTLRLSNHVHLNLK